MWLRDLLIEGAPRIKNSMSRPQPTPLWQIRMEESEAIYSILRGGLERHSRGGKCRRGDYLQPLFPKEIKK